MLAESDNCEPLVCTNFVIDYVHQSIIQQRWLFTWSFIVHVLMLFITHLLTMVSPIIFNHIRHKSDFEIYKFLIQNILEFIITFCHGRNKKIYS